MDNTFIKGFLAGVLATLAIGYIKRTLKGGKGKLPVIEYNETTIPKELVQPIEKQ